VSFVERVEKSLIDYNKFMQNKIYSVYILANEAWTLYIGVTNNLGRRFYEHQNDLIDGFSKKYKIHKLVYYETTLDVFSAIEREKQLKRWRRCKKLALIQKNNPNLDDLSSNIIS